MQKQFHWLITGGAGFIGSHLTHTLVAQKQQVTVLDNLSGGNLQNLASIQDKICFIEGDIRNFSDVLRAMKGADYVLHHAALVSVAESMENPQKTTEINVNGTQNVLEAARSCGVKRVVFASSSAVYGNRPDLPYKEITPTDCQSPYAWSKQAGAELCQLYTKAYGLETIALRYFNVFGTRQNPNSAYAAVIAKFMQLAAENKPLGIDWDGLQSRDFVHVSDVVQANLLVAQKGVPGEIYNVASGRTYTLLELADTIEKVSGRKLERVSRPKRPGDVHESSADISKICALGFVPHTTLEQGLAQMWAEKTRK
ncbi:MAG: NAD-dependent epimerase/dehydratase family protein [Elusimicrobiaceae bacterium]|nr:NAD-dependent epimerase/dehydratase family protein [Elusimicrobiaceae bacterium]